MGQKRKWVVYDENGVGGLRWVGGWEKIKAGADKTPGNNKPQKLPGDQKGRIQKNVRDQIGTK